MGTKKTYITADEFLRDSWRLAHAVRTSGWRPDVVVALWRGGAMPGVAMHEFLRATGWDVRHFPVKCSSYTGIGENAGDVVFSGDSSVFSSLKASEKVLVVDDVFDTGKTAAAVRTKMSVVGAEMRLACVYWKASGKSTGLPPEYYVRKTGNEWIVFPHEIDGLAADEVAEKDSALAGLLADALATGQAPSA